MASVMGIGGLVGPQSVNVEKALGINGVAEGSREG